MKTESSENLRIILKRKGSMWHWQLMEGGEIVVGDRPEPSAVLATEAAEIRRNHLRLMRDRAERVDLAQGALEQIKAREATPT
jgi:hypothetical protein